MPGKLHWQNKFEIFITSVVAAILVFPLDLFKAGNQIS